VTLAALKTNLIFCFGQHLAVVTPGAWKRACEKQGARAFPGNVRKKYEMVLNASFQNYQNQVKCLPTNSGKARIMPTFFSC